MDGYLARSSRESGGHRHRGRCKKRSWIVSDMILSITTTLFAFSTGEIHTVTTSSTDGFLTYRLYENAALYGNATETGTTIVPRLSLVPTDSHQTTTPCILSGELEGTVTFHQDGWYTFECDFVNTSTGWVWLDGHVVCGDNHAYQPPLWDNPIKISKTRKTTFPFRAHIMANYTHHCRNDTSVSSSLPTLQVSWKRESLTLRGHDGGAGLVNTIDLDSNIPTTKLLQQQQSPAVATFHPQLPVPEQRREELQRRLKQGWGYWLRSNILSIVKLPEGLVLSFQFCRLSRHSTGTPHNFTTQCLDVAVPDTKNVIRVDLHAYDRSYSSFNISFAGRTIQMESSVTGMQQQELQYLVSVTTPPSAEPQQDDGLMVRIVPRYAWFRPGSVNRIPGGISFQTPGLGTVNFTTIAVQGGYLGPESKMQRHLKHTKTSANDPIIEIPIPSTDLQVGFVAGITDRARLPKSVWEMQMNILGNKNREEERIRNKFGSKEGVAIAIQAAVMWTLIYNPVENGPFLPVARSSSWDFGERVKAVNGDWTYVIFDWDNFFASLLSGLDNRDIAYSNLFQVVKSKTAAGFIPNWSTGGLKSQDRSEPPVGAKVLHELYRKYNDKWIVEALFDDLLDWNNWFMENRMINPPGVIALGSFYETHSNDKKPPARSNTMWAARMESGLDNSPMYDGELFDEQSHLMEMSDVGMSSLVCLEAYSLAALADAIGRDPIIGEMLRKRGDALLLSILSHFWDHDRQIFANRYHFRTNHTMVSHITPTSLYPFLFINYTVWKEYVHQPRPEVVEMIISSWLLNSTRFCIATNGDFEGNDPNGCFWGLPSVSADDPTYMSGNWNYWRGLIWGPMSQIVFWSLQSGSGSTAVNSARAALCRQMEALLMSQWNENRHICENYSPYKNATDCSGTNFYHWGALNGLIGMIEEGYW